MWYVQNVLPAPQPWLLALASPWLAEPHKQKWLALLWSQPECYMFDMIMLSILAVSDLTDIQEQKKKPSLKPERTNIYYQMQI